MNTQNPGYTQTFLLILSSFITYMTLVSVIWFKVRTAPDHRPIRRVPGVSDLYDEIADLSECMNVRDDIEDLARDLRWSESYLKDLGTDQPRFRRSGEEKTGEQGTFPAFLKPDLWDFLNLTDLETVEDSVDVLFGEKLAVASKEYASYHNSKGMCLKGVRIALHQVLLEYMDGQLPTGNLHLLKGDNNRKGSYRRSPGRSADHFKKWAEENPFSLCFLLGLGDVSHVKSAMQIPGGVHLYKRGRCGFHHKFGHIEVLVNSRTGEACSDHCRVPDRSCKPDMVLAPVASCDWLTLYQSLQDRVLKEFESSLNIYEPTYRVDTWRDEERPESGIGT